MNHQPYRGPDQFGDPGYQSPPTPPYHMPPNPYKRPVRQNANAAAAGLLLIEIISAVVIYLIIEILVLLSSTGSHLNLSDAVYELLDMIVYLLYFGIPILIVTALTKIPVQVAFPMKRLRASLWVPAVFFCLGVSYAGSTLSSIISALTDSFFGVTPTTSLSGPPTGVLAGILYFISMAVLPALLEEMMFRGVIMQSLRRFGDGFALVISALLFSMCHGNLVQIPPTFLSGLAIGYFVLRSGSLLMGIVIHFANNALAVVFDYVYEYGSSFAWGIANIFFLLIYIVAATVALIYLVFRHANMFKIAPSGYPLHESEKYVLFFTSVLPIIYIVVMVIQTIAYFE